MYEAAFVVAVIMALTQFVKGYIPGKYAPLVTLVLGIVAGIVYLPAANIQEGIMNGVIIALSANGMFDVTKMLHKTTL
ncbi:hypothetical protein SAMN05660649_04357 [Desulfotomaculum arcticum]|uniref:Holin n=1 Tax=Desulfotruncus arcticus DSM 17038 TaxID=1121424 RepID=A0A1I2YB29_9FIRM|nr:hypothetical protein [Desulfotruncus arcticus]SFH22825.1 hypothetical protein SAMN05660649_04357 [Desulfotomaculum arcticum] [Desulfotruncus arcticus DSM 17038]